MSIHVKLSTTLRQCVPGYNPNTGISLPLPGPTTALAIATQLGLPIADIKLVMVNGRHSALENTVAPGDEIAFFPPVGGG